MNDTLDEQNPGERVIVFVDGNNLYHRLKEKGWPTWVSVGELAKRLTGGQRRLVRTYYYNAAPPNASRQEERGRMYLAMVRGAPDIVFRQSRLQPTTRVDKNGVQYRTFTEKGADTALTADMVRGAAEDEYDIAILVSSDGDFAPAAEMVKSTYGKLVEVVYFKRNRPIVMDNIARMREFRQSLLQELDKPPRSSRSPRHHYPSP